MQVVSSSRCVTMPDIESNRLQLQTEAHQMQSTSAIEALREGTAALSRQLREDMQLFRHEGLGVNMEVVMHTGPGSLPQTFNELSIEYIDANLRRLEAAHDTVQL